MAHGGGRVAEDWRERAEKQGFTVGPMRISIELPDGGNVEVTDPSIVPMGDAFAHRELTYTRDGNKSRPACEIVFEVRNRVPVCSSVRIHSDSEIHVRSRDLNMINLENLRDDAYAAAGVFMPNPDGGYVHKRGLSSFKRDRKRVEAVTRRRKVTPELLSQVAEVYKSAPVGGRLKAIETAFVVSPRQAIRYKKQAEEMGLIGDE
jgi:hypothetical protein